MAAPAQPSVRDVAISVSSVTKTFKRKQRGALVALQEVSFDVRLGGFVSIVGQSGSGKSTLLRIIGGLLDTDSGRVTLAPAPQHIAGPQAAFVFQRPLLLDWMSVLENVLLPARLAHVPRAKMRARATELLERVGIGEFGSHWPKELSGGMQQRAALARALLLEPSVLLLDEPFGSLDALTREELNLELARLWWQAEDSPTILMVTHDIAEAVFLSDEVIVLSRRPGRVVDLVRVEFERPRSPEIIFTPEFGAYVERIKTSLGINVHEVNDA
jgi:NitT/TauT family transport system ATP-binding protein